LAFLDRRLGAGPSSELIQIMCVGDPLVHTRST
jgi:hypothetical protein